MAFTIRNLSNQAAINLEKIQKHNEDIKTNTKAVELALEKYFSHLEEIQRLRFLLEESSNDLFTAKDQLEDIRNAFKIIMSNETIETANT